MKIGYFGKAARPSKRTVLQVESLDGRVMPSATMSLPAALPAEARMHFAEPGNSQFGLASGNHQVSNYGGVSGGVLRSGSGGEVTIYVTRSAGEEIPQ